MIRSAGGLQVNVASRRRVKRGYSRNRTEYDARRRARRDGELERQYRTIIRHDPCVLCGQRVKVDVDHIVGLDQGGEDQWDNMAPACPPCNRGVKKDRTLLQAMLLKAED